MFNIYFVRRQDNQFRMFSFDDFEAAHEKKQYWKPRDTLKGKAEGPPSALFNAFEWTDWYSMIAQ